MESTICPWCQTEIVWDEELGAEEQCPYCHNELKGYRTLNIQLGDEEEFEDEADGDEEGADYWEEGDTHLDAIRRVESFVAGGGDLLAYESGVEKVLDGQDEVPECPHCREYMLHAGQQEISGSSFEPVVPKGMQSPLLSGTLKLNVYVCSACFSVSRFLAEEERNTFIRTVSEKA
ncbi:hypothetical protein MKX50_07755 [Paenibacillus sp. FSL W8-0186]|uniref:Uncharacterized protein n=1 Tax=Paenibacillus woosongensis TaxID=307580 RepID=A0A7X3CM90_9BACL|nr:hypothetical protein [Paenibacillus woosongensis]MUG43917.1 hypothetical protein [Paenibacillus woosongensis]GIP57127.1 hypothetical protein J15TS10_09410 [Paenibacillus woosongensis]